MLSRKPRGGGHEKTREELLQSVKAERAERSEARRRSAAALLIQRFWRGHGIRSRLHSTLATAFLCRVEPYVSDPAKHMPTSTVVDWLLPHLCFLLKPYRPADGHGAIKLSGEPLRLARGAFALLIKSLSSSDPGANFLGVALAEPTQGHGGQKGNDCRAWEQTFDRLLLICCLLIGGGDEMISAAAARVMVLMTDPQQSKLSVNSDLKLDLSSRLMCLLARKHHALLFGALYRVLAPNKSSCPVTSFSDGSPSSAPRLGSSPDVSATQKAATQRTLSLSLNALRASLHIPEDRQHYNDHHQQQSPSDSVNSRGAADDAYATEASAEAFLSLVLTQPCIVEQLPQDIKAQLRSPPVLRVLYRSLQAMCARDGGGVLKGRSGAELKQGRSQPIATHPSQASSTTPASAARAPACAAAAQTAPVMASEFRILWGFVNVTLLTIGRWSVVAAAGEKGGGGAAPQGLYVRTLCEDRVIPDGHTAAAYTRMACGALRLGGAVLQRAVGFGADDRVCVVEELGAVAAQLWPLSQRGFILDMLSALEGGREEGGSCMGKAGAGAESKQGTKLGTRACDLNHVRTLHPSEEEGLPAFCGMYSAVMELLPALAQELVAHGMTKEAAGLPSMLSSLSFTPGILPRIWRWCASNIGLPLEVPPQASRGLDVQALGGGYKGLAPAPALVLSLFARMFNHLLVVLDDAEFYNEGSGGGIGAGRGSKGGSLSIGQTRAVAACLNSLIFHSYLPRSVPSPAPRSAASSPLSQPCSVDGSGAADGVHKPAVVGSGNDAYSALVGTAPLLLRSLYERDARRSFCQPSLWLAPYLELFGEADTVHAPGHASSGSGTIHTAQRAAAAFFEDAENEEPVGFDPRASNVAGYPAVTVLQSLAYGEEENEDEEAASWGSANLGSGGPQQQEGAPRMPQGVSRPAAVAAILRTSPQSVPFGRRLDVFRAFLVEDMRRNGFNCPLYEGGAPPIKITVRRGSHMMDDAYAQLARLGPTLRARLIVNFVNEQGLSEAGMDFGGLMKEFLEEVVVRGFHADYGLFTTTPDGLFYPRPSADKLASGLQLVEFLGMMVGKALYEGLLINVAFAPFFVSRLQGRTPVFDDLRTLDPELHRSLWMVKNYEGDVADLGLTFSVVDDFFGAVTTHALLPGHANTPVTNGNRLLYCHLLADWHLNVRLGRPAEAFARGLSQLVPAASLRLFSPKEFNQLLSGEVEGGSGGLDVADMKRYARYYGGYSETSYTIKLFWQVVADFSSEERARLLKFVTSCSRAPLGGFRYLSPPFLIQKVNCDASIFAMLPGAKDVDRLPTASTCYNTLKLPNYRRKDTLRKKLLYAISSGAGFELS